MGAIPYMVSPPSHLTALETYSVAVADKAAPLAISQRNSDQSFVGGLSSSSWAFLRRTASACR